MTEASRCHREAALRRAVLAGDETSWRLWYDETFESIRRFVAWRMKPQSDGIDEILQETWLIAVKKIGQFQPQSGAFLDWVRGIAANVVKNQVRKGQARATTPLTVDVAQIENPNAAATEARVARITEVLHFLPGQYAAVLREKYLEQRSVAEIAAAWNETTKAVESLLTRARQAFREAFGLDQPESES